MGLWMVVKGGIRGKRAINRLNKLHRQRFKALSPTTDCMGKTKVISGPEKLLPALSEPQTR